MRIAFLVPSLGTLEGQGGVDHELLKRVAAAGHRVDVWAGIVPPATASLQGVRVHRVPRLPAWQLGNQLISLAATTAALRRGRYDVIHADAGVTLRRADVMVCHTLSDRWLGLPREIWQEPGARGWNHGAATRFKARLEIAQYRKARVVLANSDATAADLVARGVDAARVRVLPFGIDAHRFRPPTAEERREARATFGIPADAFVAVMVGAHGERKGLPVALDALAAAAQGEHLLVAGEHRGGRWVRDAAARGLPAVMPGKLDDVRAAYWAADALVCPSRYDAFGMAVLEAMACGLPVVVAREAGSHELVRDAGFVLATSDAAAIRSALDSLRADTAKRTAMGARARDIAVKRDWDKAGAMLLDVYASLTGDAHGRATSAA